MAVELRLSGAPEVIEGIHARSDKVLAVLIDALNEQMLRLQSYIVGEKMHGQVLHQQTGKAAASIRAVPVRQEGTDLIGAVEGGGGVAWYLRPNEFGTEPYDIRPVNAKALRFMMNGHVTFARLVHHPGLPERSVMRSSLTEFQATIVEGMQAALSEAVNL